MNSTKRALLDTDTAKKKRRNYKRWKSYRYSNRNNRNTQKEY